MKRILTSILTAAALSAPFATHLSAEEHRATAEIPFAFEVGHRTLPAGTYNLSQFKTGSAVFVVAADHGGHSVFTMLGTTKAGNPAKPSVTFACYGKECVLAKVNPPDSQVSYGLDKDSIERQLTHRLGVASMISVKLAPR